MLNPITMFSDDYAIKYENLIRSAYNCTKSGVTGASASIFRALQVSADAYEKVSESINNNSTRGIQQHELEKIARYFVNCGEVKAYILTAVDKVLKEKEAYLTTEQQDKLQSFEELLMEPTYVLLTESVIKIGDIFRELKLPRS